MGWNVEMLRRLSEGRVEYVLIGGVAANAHGSAIATNDLDVFAPLDHDNVVAVVRAFAGTNLRWRHRPDLPVLTPDNPQLRGLKNMYLRCDLGVMDVLGELPEAGPYPEVRRRATDMQIQGVHCPVIDLDSLITIKRTVAREKDLRVARELELIRSILDRRKSEGNS
jgi:hypothetical protein